MRRNADRFRFQRKSVKRIKKKIAAAVYEYQADCDGEWGEIQFDFENGTDVCGAGNETYQGL